MKETSEYGIGGLAANAALEDQLYLQADKLLALCAAQTALDNSDEPLAPGIRSHYSLLMEEQARALRSTLEKLLG